MTFDDLSSLRQGASDGLLGTIQRQHSLWSAFAYPMRVVAVDQTKTDSW